jgi:hypothetical protein
MAIARMALCNKVCQWLLTGRWFSSGPPVSSNNKSDHHDITEILLKKALNTIKHIFVSGRQIDGYSSHGPLGLRRTTYKVYWFEYLKYVSTLLLSYNNLAFKLMRFYTNDIIVPESPDLSWSWNLQVYKRVKSVALPLWSQKKRPQELRFSSYNSVAMKLMIWMKYAGWLALLRMKHYTHFIQ